MKITEASWQDFRPNRGEKERYIPSQDDNEFIFHVNEAIRYLNDIVNMESEWQYSGRYQKDKDNVKMYLDFGIEEINEAKKYLTF